MKTHFNVFVTKILFFAPALGIILPFFGPVKLSGAVMIAIVAALAAYLTADLVVLPRYGSWPAIGADAVIAVLITWELTPILGNGPLSPVGLIFVAVAVALGEWYYHSYLIRTLFNTKRRGRKR